MSGPTDAVDALAWIKDAVAAGRYIPDPHFYRRCDERGFTIFDAKRIVATATKCEPYDAEILLANGTAWRITGTDTDGSEAKLGVEAFEDHLGQRVIIITIMDA